MDEELFLNHPGSHHMSLLPTEDCEEPLLILEERLLVEEKLLQELIEELIPEELDELPVLCANAVESDTNARLPARNTEVAL